ncbi:hypothetical protein GH714_039385 [Hevea brasiliensis]|uniref:Uncharacterized protein n=1 Tax=Hevea brasiliensis TaxID=3981 RepID=A0A6A6KNA7_HEVBR|nr:hypothetical protein GH714_039385 [Hevea brasiliensis]
MASKSELRTSSSTIDSLGSLSSDGSSRCSLYSEKRKIDSKTGNHFSTVSSVKSTLKTESRSKNQSMSPRISPSVTKAKFSASISPASSISEWSLESMSPTSTLNKRTNSSRPSLDTRFARMLMTMVMLPKFWTLKTILVTNAQWDMVPRSLDCQVSVEREFQQEVVQLFIQIQSNRQGFGCHHQKLASLMGLVLISCSLSIVQEWGSGFAKFLHYSGEIRSAHSQRKEQSHPAVPRGLPRYGVENVSPSGRSNEAKLGRLQPIALAVRGTKASAQQNASEIKPKPPLPLQAPPGNASKKVGENAAYGQKKILGLLSNINEKGKTCFEDQVDHLASQVGAMDIHREIQQKPVLDSCSLHQVNESRAVKTSAQEEFVKLLMPALL